MYTICMLNIKQASDFTYSLSLWGYNEFSYARRGMEHDCLIPRCIKVLALEAGYLATTLIGIIETIFWSAVMLVVKLVHLVIPESKIEWFNEHVFEPLFMQAAGSFLGLSGSYAMLLYNFTSEETISITIDNVHNNWVTNLKSLKPIAFYHLF